jgi:hypothetical protein
MNKTRLEGRSNVAPPRTPVEARPAAKVVVAPAIKDAARTTEPAAGQDGFEAAKAIVRHQNEVKTAEKAAEEAKAHHSWLKEAMGAGVDPRAIAVYDSLRALEPECHDLEAMLAAAAKAEEPKGFATNTDYSARISLVQISSDGPDKGTYLDLTKDGFSICLHDYSDRSRSKESPQLMRDWMPARLLKGKSPLVPTECLAKIDIAQVKSRLAEERTKLADVIKTGSIPPEWIGRTVLGNPSF